MTSEPLDIRVSLVNTDHRELLSHCLASIPAACRGLRWAVTVIDNASTDGSAQMVATEFPWAEVRRNARRRGFAANHNQVIAPVVETRAARYVLILNEDTELQPDSVAALVRHGDGDERIGAVAPDLRGPAGEAQEAYRSLPTPAREAMDALRPGIRRAPRGRGYLNGSCLLLRTDALRGVGLLDDRFFIFYEDADLCRRLVAARWTLTISEGARVVHHEHQTVSQGSLDGPMSRQMLRSRHLYLRKHHGAVAAALTDVVVRIGFTLRALKALGEGLAGSDAAARCRARAFFRLARYDPRAELEHERRADADEPIPST